MRFFLIVLMLSGLVMSQKLNYGGVDDTSMISDFRADSLKYSKTFLLSAYENTRVRVVVNDTSSAGYKSDSVKFYYYVQVGSPVINSLNRMDTAWTNWAIVLDTVNALDTNNFKLGYSVYDSTGLWVEKFKLIDTVYTTGYMTNSHTLTFPWDVYFRVGVKGLTGNNKDAFLKLRVDRVGRIGVNTVGK